jgi:SAM-dependent methyltransferase
MPGSGPSDPGPDTAAGYDRVAAEYARRIAGELTGKPFDRALLDRFADQTRGRGTVADLGCGPGHVAAYLHARGVEVVGIDLSPGMVEQARRLYPELGFRQGDMRALDAPDGAFAGAVAFYSVIHLPAAERPATFAELARVLGPGAPLLVAFHVGDHTCTSTSSGTTRSRSISPSCPPPWSRPNSRAPVWRSRRRWSVTRTPRR